MKTTLLPEERLFYDAEGYGSLITQHDNLGVFACFILSYLYHGLGTTLGYHRLLAHRSLTLPKWAEYSTVLGGYLALQGSPVVWVGVHRLHHQNPDAKGDPHSPQDGFMHALLGWMFQMYSRQTNEELQALAKDVMRDRLYRLLGAAHTADHVVKCILVSVAFRVAILYALGSSALAANLFATLLIFFNAQLVNAMCHIRLPGAYRNYPTPDASSNFWVLGILALGEGWHNNHHAAPMLARHGLRAFELDVTWYVICLVEALGIARELRRRASSDTVGQADGSPRGKGDGESG